MGGGRLLIVSDQAEHFAHRTIPSERGDIANCLRTNGGLNATDNTIVNYAERRTDRDMGQLPSSSQRSTN
jgi:hypothetical protein